MRSYTGFVLGVLAAVSIEACGSTEDEPSVSVPEYVGPLPVAPSAPGVEVPGSTPGSDMTASGSTDGTVEPATPSVNEGPPDVTQLDPIQPPAADGSGEGGAGGAANPPVEPTPEVPVEEPPPAPEARTQVFLLFGQSNMYGLPNPQAEDLQIDPRVEVLTLEQCGRHGRDQWMPAQPPLHGCVGQPSGSVFGPGLGPGDYFAREIAAAFPDDTILLVPNAIPGVSIDVFQPGQQAYNSIVARARMAQERGEIRGMIFHQGESDCGSQASWPGRVKNVVDQLRSDLGIGDVPFVAGELLRLFGCAAGMNPVIGSLPNTITNTAVVSSQGNFGAVQGDNYNNLHFDLAAQREFGRRYGEAMLGLLQP
jgi:hypothetical protein